MSNPFFDTWDTPFGMPPFDRILTEHFTPAFDAAFAEHEAEVAAIREAAKAATFANTVAAFEHAGAALNRVASVFFNFTSSLADAELLALENEVSPRWAAHFSALFTDQGLFARVDTVFANEVDALIGEDRQLLLELHKRFVRAGAALSAEARQRVNVLDEELATLTTRFGQNVLNATNNFQLVLDETDLDGLPALVRAAAAAEAESKGHPGSYVVTISRSSFTPFMQFSERRDLRERLYQAYTTCGNMGDETDNNTVIAEIVARRAERAGLLGFESHAGYMLDDRMAKTPAGVRNLLDEIWGHARRKVRAEADDLQARIRSEGGNFALEPWDWWYYTEKVRSDRFDFDETDIKPYFPLPAVREGAFSVATKLYGITFERIADAPVYHPDVEVYEVKEADGTHVGTFLVDYFMRPTKRGGAWMSTFREQAASVRPIVVNCCNFPKAPAGEATLLGMDEVRTLFHEFGHGLHGLLSQAAYQSLAGTNVKQDFVELPSQIMEHWAREPEVLRNYARHVETGEVIPEDLIDKLLASDTFNQGFMTTEYLAASYLDLDWHEAATMPDVQAFEADAMKRIEIIGKVAPRYHSTYFQHIFSGDHYSAGYYSYIWAEVLDADGYDAFAERGIFDRETARAFRAHVLEKGGTEDPAVLYERFRGRAPDTAPLLRHRGLV